MEPDRICHVTGKVRFFTDDDANAVLDKMRAKDHPLRAPFLLIYPCHHCGARHIGHDHSMPDAWKNRRSRWGRRVLDR